MRRPRLISALAAVSLALCHRRDLPAQSAAITDWSNLGRYRAANAQLPPPSSGEARVVFMGNSITEGWAPRFATDFPGKPYIGRGISGQTTPQMLLRFRQDVIALAPKVVVILAGTNDIAGNTGPSTLEMIEDNLASMTELAQSAGIRVVLCSVLPVSDYPWKRGLEPGPKIVALNAWIARYAERVGAVYADFHTPMKDEQLGLPSALAADGVHPTEAGYRMMAPIVERAIAVALAKEPAGTAPRTQLAAQFRETLEGIARRTPGIVGFAVTDLTSGERFTINGAVPFPQGSAIKIPILVELFRQAEQGMIRLDERVPVRAADQVGGTGVAQWFGDGTSTLSWQDLATLMIVLSDNTATNLLIDKLGMTSVNGTMVSLGLGAIRLQRKMIRPLSSARGEENLATPATAVALLERIHRCTLPMSRARCEALRRILEIPKDGPIPASVPVGTRVAWKPGTVEGVETAWGLVALPGRPYALAVMTTYADEQPGQQAIRGIADASYEYFRRLARASAFGVRVPLSLADSIRVPNSPDTLRAPR